MYIMQINYGIVVTKWLAKQDVKMILIKASKLKMTPSSTECNRNAFLNTIMANHQFI